MVMVPLSLYSIISVPLVLTLGCQCGLETFKSNIFEELLFYTKQNKRLDRIGKVFYKTSYLNLNLKRQKIDIFLYDSNRRDIAKQAKIERIQKSQCIRVKYLKSNSWYVKTKI